jgi:BirA family biotin operon repressor/biotin-[acetyl-CoA-carboxylase] ligase
MNSEIDRINYLIVGIGINVNVEPSSFPPDIRGTATSLNACLNRPVSRLEVLRRCLEELEQYYENWKIMGFERILLEWTELSATLGKPVKVKVMEDVIEGVAEDLEADGSLRLRLNDGTTYRVIAGDVMFGEEG